MSDSTQDPASTQEPAAGHGLLARLIAWCAHHPLPTLLTVGLACFVAVQTLQHTRLDALPDVSDVQVIVFTEWEGQGPNVVEDQITWPLSSALLSSPKVKAVRGQSMFGMSFVYVIFDDDTDLYWARTRVLEKLSSVQARLPDGVAPELGPDATGVGWVFQYALVDTTGQHSLQELRSLQDFTLRDSLGSVPGVAEVATVGGGLKQYEVNVDPVALQAHGVSMNDVIAAVRGSSDAFGGRSIEVAGHEQIVRGRGYLTDARQLENTPVKALPGGAALLLGQVAHVAMGTDSSRGTAELDGQGEVVGGVIVMRFGENALQVIDAVKERLDEVRQGLPKGVELRVVYDRSELIEAAIDTLKRTLTEEMLVVAAILFLFLMHVRSALVALVTLPVAVLLAFIPMVLQGITANVMSLAGIAVAIGEMADASVILIENIHKRLEEWEAKGRPGARLQVVISAMQEVGPSVFSSLLVMTVSFLPVFALASTEGRLFHPLAYTKTYSMGFAAILAVTLTPALAALLVRGKIRREDQNPIQRWLMALYAPVVRWTVRWRGWVIGGTVAAMLGTIPAYLALESEFMPSLYEGSLLYMPTAPPGMSLAEAQRVLQAMDQELKDVPEVASVFGKAGRAETATDPAPLSMFETTIILKPKSEWRPGLTWDALIADLDERLRYPGMPNLWWQPIQTRTEMLSTGIRAPVGIQLYGDDLEVLEKTALEVEQVVKQVEGTRSASAERATGGFYLDVDVDRAAASRWGLTVADVHQAVGTAVGGKVVAETVQGRERYGIRVRYAHELRDTPEALGAVRVDTPLGTPVSLSDVARLEFRSGPPMLRSEAGKLAVAVFIDTSRPVPEWVDDARPLVEREIQLPKGVRLEWTGQFKAYERAQQRLMLAVPATLLLVCLLLYFATRSWIETGIVLLAVPFSLIGAVWLLWALDFNLSVAVWVGLIALMGLDAETGVIMLLYLTMSHRRAKEEGKLRDFGELTEAIVDGAAKRIRPKLMTVLTTVIGLLPIIWSTGAGADVAKRIAAPMVGGVGTSFLLELLVYPAIFALWKSRELPKPALEEATAT